MRKAKNREMIKTKTEDAVTTSVFNHVGGKKVAGHKYCDI